jgi:hypothetical protein
MKNGLKRPKIRFVEDCGGPVRFDFSNPRITDPTHVSTANSTQYTRRLERNFQWWCHVSSGEPLPRDLHHPITVTLYLLLYLLNHQISLSIKLNSYWVVFLLFCFAGSFILTICLLLLLKILSFTFCSLWTLFFHILICLYPSLLL